MKLRDKIGIIVGILAILCGLWQSGKYLSSYIDTRYALAQETKKEIQDIKQTQSKESQRLDYKILSDQYNEIQKRIWQIEDRYPKATMPNTVNEEYRELKEKKEGTKKKIDVIEEKIK